METNNHCVYWYYFSSYSDPFSEGYIGVTNNFHRRNKEHRTNINTGKVNHFYNAVRYHKDEELLCKILHSNLSIEAAYSYEELYRPENNIAWNSAAGGEYSLERLTTPVSLFHQSNPTEVLHFPSITKASETLDISMGRISTALRRKSNTYGRDGWHVVNENTNISTILTYSELCSKLVKGVKRNKPSHFKNKKRWSEEDKIRIGNQHRGKTISEEQKEIMRIKNRLSNPSCTEITLQHKDSEKTYTFHSISEASRQLDIPLARLKSKCQRPLGRYGHDGWAILSQDKGSV